MQSQIEEIRQNLKEARNLAYLCKYDEAIKFYKQIIDAIEQQIILNNVSRKSLEDWRTFQADVIQEKTASESIKSMLSGMNHNSSAIYTRNDRPLPNSSPSIQYEDPFRATNSNFRATNRGFSASRGKPSSKANNK